jgi:hypothetical protein
MTTPTETRSDWNKPKPERIPRPTYAPMAMAGGIVLAAWGVLFSWMFIVVGVALFIAGLAGWLNEIRRSAE